MTRPWIRNLLIGLIALYVVELIALNNGAPLDPLAWFPIRSGQFEIWQPLTHLFVQGRSWPAPVFGALVLYFFLPPLDEQYARRTLAEAFGAAAFAGVVLAFFVDAIGVFGAHPAMGWSHLATAACVLFGLTLPNQTIHLWFVLPLRASFFVWAALAVALFSVFGSGLYGGEHLGAWLGMYGWYETRGPGGHRRALQRKKQAIENELRRFTVIEGGKQDAPNREDDLVH